MTQKPLYIFYSALQHYSAKSKCCLQVITLVIRTNNNNELTWVFILFKHVCLKRSITDVTWDHWLFRVFWVCQHQKPFLINPARVDQTSFCFPVVAIRGFHCSISTWSNGPLLIQALCIVNVQQILSSTSRPFPSAWVLNFLKTFKVILHSHWSWYLAHFFVFTSSMCSFQSTVYSSTINFWYSDHVRQQPWWFCLGWKL